MKQRKKGRRRERGFTLVEIIAVVVILGVLASLLVPKVFQMMKGSQRRIAVMQIKKLEAALGLFQLDVGRFPTSEEGLRALIINPGIENWNGPYGNVNRPDLKDPWGKDYIYWNPCHHTDVRHEYDLFTYGPTGVEGGTGASAPIASWEQ